MKSLFLPYIVILCLFPALISAQPVVDATTIETIPVTAVHPDLSLYYQWLAAESRDSIYYKAYQKFNALTVENAEDVQPSVTSRRRRNQTSQLHALSAAFTQAFWVDKNYDEAFFIGLQLEELLSGVSESEFPQKRQTYFRLGEAYYLFLDFHKSIALLQQALNPTPLSFLDTANLDALNILGICYANLGQMEQSDSYFRATLKSHDIVIHRPHYNAYAISHIGCNEMLRGNYDNALLLSSAVWKVLRQTDNYGHLAGMCYCRGRSYLQKGDYKSASLWVDSLVYFARKDTYNPVKRIKQAYLLLTDYYNALGDIRLTRLYADSLLGAYRENEGIHTSAFIAQASERHNRERLAAQESALRVNRTRILAISLFALCSLIVIGVIASLYRKKNAAYKLLAQRAREWASTDYPAKISDQSHEQPTAEDNDIMSRLHHVMTVDFAYRDPNLTAEILAERFGIHRNQLSRAVNRTTGGNFNLYVNNFRIKEAVRILSENSHSDLNMHELYESVGFNSRTSFYRVFKQITGLSLKDFN